LQKCNKEARAGEKKNLPSPAGDEAKGQTGGERELFFLRLGTQKKSVAIN